MGNRKTRTPTGNQKTHIHHRRTRRRQALISVHNHYYAHLPRPSRGDRGVAGPAATACAPVPHARRQSTSSSPRTSGVASSDAILSGRTHGRRGVALCWCSGSSMMRGRGYWQRRRQWRRSPYPCVWTTSSTSMRSFTAEASKSHISSIASAAATTAANTTTTAQSPPPSPPPAPAPPQPRVASPRLARARGRLRQTALGVDGATIGTEGDIGLMTPSVPYSPSLAAARFASQPLAVGMRQVKLLSAARLHRQGRPRRPAGRRARAPAAP